MPSGYTYKIEDDPNFTFQQFAWECARAFIIEMKEAPPDKRIPKCIEVPPYYHDAVVRSRKELARLQAMTPAEYHFQQMERFRQHAAEWEEYEQQRKEMKARYDRMTAAAEAWNAPETHAELKKFMLAQLTASSRWAQRPNDKPMPPDPEVSAARLEDAIETSKTWLAATEKCLAEAIAGVEKVNAWLATLRAELPQP